MLPTIFKLSTFHWQPSRHILLAVPSTQDIKILSMNVGLRLHIARAISIPLTKLRDVHIVALVESALLNQEVYRLTDAVMHLRSGGAGYTQHSAKLS